MGVCCSKKRSSKVKPEENVIQSPTVQSISLSGTLKSPVSSRHRRSRSGNHLKPPVSPLIDGDRRPPAFSGHRRSPSFKSRSSKKRVPTPRIPRTKDKD